MNVYGELTSAQCENLAADPSLASATSGRLWYRTDISQFKCDLGGSADTLAMLAATQTFINKTISAVANTITSLGGSNFASQSANTFLAGPTSGSAAAPTFRTISTSDLPAGPGSNVVVNSAFDFWQRGTSSTFINSSTGYLPDRWLLWQNLGTNAVVTVSQVGGTVTSSVYACKVQITTAPTAAQAAHLELNYSWDTFASLSSLYSQTLSVSAQVKALGNVNAIQLSLYRNASEGKCYSAVATTTLGSHNQSINSSGFTLVTWTSIAPFTIGLSGNVGLSFSINGVSSGNIWDLNNGFVVEQVQVNVGTNPLPFSRMFPNAANEFAACQRYYEKSYDPTVALGTVSSLGAVQSTAAATEHYVPVYFKVTKRTASYTLQPYSPGTGSNANYPYDVTSSADTSLGFGGTGKGTNGFSFHNTGLTDGHTYSWHWTCDAEL